MAVATYMAIATVAMISDLYQLLLYYSYTVHIMQSLLIFWGSIKAAEQQL